MSAEGLSSLFTPFSLKNITLRNRFVMPAMQRGRCQDGVPSAQMVDYYRRRVEGGVSLVIGESAAVEHPSSTQQEGAAHLFGQEARPSGRNRLLETARGLQRGEFDLVGVGRAVIGDSNWVSKVREERWSELRPFRREDMMVEWEMDFVLDAHGQQR